MNWKKLVGKVAPMLGTALGGPFGGMAGKFLADKLGVKEEELPNYVESASPEVMLQIKQLENDFRVHMRELGLREEELHAEDRANARDMAKHTSLKPQVVIASVFIIGFITVLYIVFAGKADLSPESTQMANILLGILSAGIMQIMNFFFGSSAGSKVKDAIQAKLGS